ncbi:MAG: hypothetical protein Tsb005_15950 [Gammaproteobacteria bacterium]
MLALSYNFLKKEVTHFLAIDLHKFPYLERRFDDEDFNFHGMFQETLRHALHSKAAQGDSAIPFLKTKTMFTKIM